MFDGTHEHRVVAGGHLARMQEELRNLTTLQILEAILGAGAMAGGAVSAGLGVFSVAGSGAGLGVATGAAVVGLAMGAGGGSRGTCTQSLLLAA